MIHSQKSEDLCSANEDLCCNKFVDAPALRINLNLNDRQLRKFQCKFCCFVDNVG